MRRDCARAMMTAGLYPGQSPLRGASLHDLIAGVGGVTALNIEDYAPLFYSFARNREAIAQWLARLWDRDADLLDLQREFNSYNRHSLVLEVGPNWIVRLAAWPATMPPEREAHTHNVALLTYGLAGPGYVTDLYHVNRDELATATIGDRVSLLRPQRLHLTPDRELFYPAHIIAHRQCPPETYSVSLNFIVTAHDIPPLYQRQYFIEPERGTVVRIKE
jgi:hypothetical protein